MFRQIEWIDVSTWGTAAFSVLGWTLSLLMTLLVIPYLRRLMRVHREQALMIRKKLFEHTGVVLFGVFDKKLQSDYLGGFLTTLFGEVLFDQIVGWNNRPSPSLIMPRSRCEAEHLREMLAAHASPFVLQNAMIGCYFKDVQAQGTPHYRYATFVVGLARPDAAKLQAHDYPRVIVIEESNLRKVLEETGLDPQWDTQDGRVWLETVRELGEAYFAGKRDGIATLEVPLSR